ncbi:hypothetical protein OBA45_00850, partial [bacterium]|nr:hypothetical protein [bacterium]
LFQMPESTANALATVKCAYLRCHVEDPLENSLKNNLLFNKLLLLTCAFNRPEKVRSINDRAPDGKTIRCKFSIQRLYRC